MDCVVESERRIPVVAYLLDVPVCGGGVVGITAAVLAARNGRIALLTKNTFS